MVLICHRIVFIVREGHYVTKGDANKHDDRRYLLLNSEHRQFGIKRQNMRGKVWLRIPRLGLPVLWIRETYWAKVLFVYCSLHHITSYILYLFS